MTRTGTDPTDLTTTASTTGSWPANPGATSGLLANVENIHSVRLCPVCLCEEGDHRPERKGPADGPRAVCPPIPKMTAQGYVRAATVVGTHQNGPSGMCSCGERLGANGYGAHLLLAFERADLRVVNA